MIEYLQGMFLLGAAFLQVVKIHEPRLLPFLHPYHYFIHGLQSWLGGFDGLRSNTYYF